MLHKLKRKSLIEILLAYEINQLFVIPINAANPFSAAILIVFTHKLMKVIHFKNWWRKTQKPPQDKQVANVVLFY